MVSTKHARNPNSMPHSPKCGIVCGCIPTSSYLWMDGETTRRYCALEKNNWLQGELKRVLFLGLHYMPTITSILVVNKHLLHYLFWKRAANTFFPFKRAWMKKATSSTSYNSLTLILAKTISTAINYNAAAAANCLLACTHALNSNRNNHNNNKNG